MSASSHPEDVLLEDGGQLAGAAVLDFISRVLLASLNVTVGLPPGLGQDVFDCSSGFGSVRVGSTDGFVSDGFALLELRCHVARIVVCRGVVWRLFKEEVQLV